MAVITTMQQKYAKSAQPITSSQDSTAKTAKAIAGLVTGGPAALEPAKPVKATKAAKQQATVAPQDSDTEIARRIAGLSSGGFSAVMQGGTQLKEGITNYQNLQPVVSVEQRVNDIVRDDSLLMQRAWQSGLRAANQRGLLNSSMAAKSAQDSVFNAALPIASQDADIATRERLQVMAAQDAAWNTDKDVAARMRLQEMGDYNSRLLAAGGNMAENDRNNKRLAQESELAAKEAELRGSIQKMQNENALALADKEAASRLALQQLSNSNALTLADKEAALRTSLQDSTNSNALTLADKEAANRLALADRDAAMRTGLLEAEIAANDRNTLAKLVADQNNTVASTLAQTLQNEKIPANARYVFEDTVSRNSAQTINYLQGLYNVPTQNTQPTAQPEQQTAALPPSRSLVLSL